jgi:hypothetical protein
MTDKQPLGELLLHALDAIDEVGGPERHQLVQVIGRDAYEALIAKPKGAAVVSRWIDATGKAKGPATKALSIAIARVADKPELVARIEREIGDVFDEGIATTERSPTPTETKKHAAAVNQRRNGQRSSYQAPKGVDLAQLAKGSDVSKYIKARQNSHH